MEKTPFIYTVQSDPRGVKAVGMNALNWDLMFKTDTGSITSLSAYHTVAWVRRAVDVRANALSAIPFRVYSKRGKDVTENWPISQTMPSLLWRIEAGLQIYGAGYLAVNKNVVGIDREFAWLLPSSITPKYDSKVGITGFERRVKGAVIPLDTEDLIYIWQPNIEAELGPGIGWVQTVLAEADMAKSVNDFAQQFFERGAVPAMILSVDGNPPRDELDRLESWWRHLLSGVRRAWETVAMRATVKPVTVGYPTKDLAMPELMQLVRNQIAVASGVPQTMFEDAAQVATRVAEDRQSFYMETIIPEAHLIENALNKQYFDKQGWRCELDYNALDIFQEDEASRADALTKYTLAGFPLLMACEVLGIDLTDEQKRALAAQERKPEPAPVVEAVEQEPPREVEEMPVTEIRKELRRWHSKAAKALKAGKPADVPFESALLPAEFMTRVKALLAEAQDEDALAEAFYKAADTIPAVLRITEDDIRRALQNWDEIMPAEFRGLLDAKAER